MNWLRRLKARLNPSPVCQCGIAHGPLMTLDMRGRLSARHVPLGLIRHHFAREFSAARELARRLAP